jgi:hypothetical protein
MVAFPGVCLCFIDGPLILFANHGFDVKRRHPNEHLRSCRSLGINASGGGCGLLCGQNRANSRNTVMPTYECKPQLLGANAIHPLY